MFYPFTLISRASNFQILKLRESKLQNPFYYISEKLQFIANAGLSKHYSEHLQTFGQQLLTEV